jgi:hypothetical protein
VVSNFPRKRKIALAAAWAAAYALVLNVLLASALLAAQLPAQIEAGHEFCFASVNVAATPDDAGKAKPSPIRCPLCLGQHVSATPPPMAPALAIRIAFGIRYEPLRATSFVALNTTHDHQPRGPPALI